MSPTKRPQYHRLVVAALWALSRDRTRTAKGVHVATLRTHLRTCHADALGLRWGLAVSRHLRKMEECGDVIAVGHGGGRHLRLAPTVRRRLNKTPPTLSATLMPATPTATPSKHTQTGRRMSVTTASTPRAHTLTSGSATAIRRTTTAATTSTDRRVQQLTQQCREAAGRARDAARELSLLRAEHDALLRRHSALQHTAVDPTTHVQVQGDGGRDTADSAVDTDILPAAPEAACGRCGEAEAAVVLAKEEQQRKVGEAQARVAAMEGHVGAAVQQLDDARRQVAEAHAAAAALAAHVAAVEAERDEMAARLRDVTQRLDDVTATAELQSQRMEEARGAAAGVAELLGQRLQLVANMLIGPPQHPLGLRRTPTTATEVLVDDSVHGDDEGRPATPNMDVTWSGSGLIGSASGLLISQVPLRMGLSAELIGA